MGIVRAMITMPTKSALNEDTIVNTWHFNTLGTAELTSLDTISSELATFYQSFIPLYSTKMQPSGTQIRFYRLSDPKPRPPIYTDSLFSTAVVPHATAALPSECAIVLTYQGDRQAGKDQKRRRGRIYLGPWAALGAQGDNDRPGTGITNAVHNAASALLAASNSAGGVFQWVVYSQTSVDQNIGDPYVKVTNGYVDNSWDTQRRRGLDAITREQFGVIAGPPGRVARSSAGEPVDDSSAEPSTPTAFE